MQVSPTLQAYTEARQYLTPFADDAAAPTNPLCIICFQYRDLDYSTERNTRSHIITNSLLHTFGSGEDSARLELENSSVINFMDFSYKAYCKHRRTTGFTSCEDCLNVLGEQALPEFMNQFVGDSLKNAAPLQFNNPRVFHAITTIGWRILASSFDSSYNADKSAVAFRCLEYIRPLIRNAEHNINSKFAVMLHVVGQKTVDTWISVTGANVDEMTRNAIVAPLIGTVSSGSKSELINFSGVHFLHWNAILGPLMIKYIFLDQSPSPLLEVGGILKSLESIGFQRIPSSGQFTVQSFENRPGLEGELIKSNVLHPLARAYALAFRSQGRHWLQRFSRLEVLVPADYGRFEEDLDTITVSVGPYRTLVGDYKSNAHGWNPQVLECRIYQVSGSIMVLYAEFNAEVNGEPKLILSASRIIRSETQKYASVQAIRDAHAEYLQPHEGLLLGMLRHIDPLDDTQLPPPAPPAAPQGGFNDEFIDEDTFGSLFG